MKENMNLDSLAIETVGDGHLPNIFFVSVDSKVVATFVLREDAIDFAERMFNSRLEVWVEDRLDGEVWMNASAQRSLSDFSISNASK